MAAYPKKDGHTRQELHGGCKQIKAQFLNLGQASDIGVCPPDRVYTRDYAKIDEVPDTDDTDTVSAYVGNPLAI